MAFPSAAMTAGYSDETSAASWVGLMADPMVGSTVECSAVRLDETTAGYSASPMAATTVEMTVCSSVEWMDDSTVGQKVDCLVD